MLIMNKKLRLYQAAKANPQNTKFLDLLKLAGYVGFVHDRTKGSHQQFKRSDDPKQLIPFQPDKRDKSKAKPYQVRLLVNFIEENNLQSMLEE